jgi:transposase
MARPADPQTIYRVRAHVTHGHTYASTQRMVSDSSGIMRRRHIHWGVLENNKFTPWADFLALPATERAKFVFPAGWDLSMLDKLSDRRKQGRPMLDCDAQNRLYGDIWLLEQIAEKTKMRRDLEVVFEGNDEIVDAIMALAMFPYLTKFSYNRVERWQRNVKSPCGFPLSPKTITRLTQSVTEQHRMQLLKIRAGRLDEGEMCAVDSTSRSAYGDSLADVRWGKNKEQLPLEQTLEVVVYALSSHMPVYYRTFPGNMPDSRSLDVIMKDLEDAGFGNVALITDRGYDSLKNVEKCILKGRAMLMSVKVGQTFIMEKIRELGSFETCPDGMSVDRETELCHRQYDLDHTVISTNGRDRKAERLKMNLYLDTKRRAATLLDLRIGLDAQREELDKLLIEKAMLECDATLKKNFCYYKITYDKKTREIRSFEVDATKVAKRRLLAGFFASLTHMLDFDAMTAYHHYKLRDEQEKYFEQMKDQMGADRQRCWSEEGRNGRQLILFVALVLSSHVRHIWKTKMNKQFSSSLEILDEMRSIRCIEHAGHARKITPFVGAQLDICKAFGFEPPKGCDVKYESIRKPEQRRGRPRKKVTVVDSE